MAIRPRTPENEAEDWCNSFESHWLLKRKPGYLPFVTDEDLELVAELKTRVAAGDQLVIEALATFQDQNRGGHSLGLGRHDGVQGRDSYLDGHGIRLQVTALRIGMTLGRAESQAQTN